MSDFTLFALLALGIVGYLLLKFVFGKPENPLGIAGKLIWVDRGRQTKPFFNRQYKVLGKPDLMYQLDEDGVMAVEYKSRNGRIFESDIAQGKAAALAARGAGYDVRHLLVKTSKTEQRFALPQCNDQLYGDIKEFVKCARSAKRGHVVTAKPQRYKCRTCAYGQSCQSSAA